MAFTYTVGVNPTSIAVSPKGKFAYVTNSNGFGVTNQSTVSVLNLEEKCLWKTIRDPSFVGPYRVAIDRTGTYAYVCNSGSPATSSALGTISKICCKTQQVVSVISGFDGAGGIVLNRKGTVAYVTNYGAPGGLGSGNGHTVSVVDLKKGVIESTIETNQAPAALRLSPCGRVLYVVCYVDGAVGTGTLQAICTKSQQVWTTFSGFSGPFDIVLSPCGRYAFVSNFGSNNFDPIGTSVTVLDLYKNGKRCSVEVGLQPGAMTTNGKYVFVGNYNALYASSNSQNLTYGEGTLSMIDVKKQKVVGRTIAIGQSPSGLTLSPDLKSLFVTKYAQNTVEEIPVTNFYFDDEDDNGSDESDV